MQRHRKMLPSFYQTCLQAQLSQTQFVTLEILVDLLQKERRISIERLATLFPQLTPQAVWFPIIKQWIKQDLKQDHNLLQVSLVYQKRAIPLYWMWLDKKGQS